MTTKEAIYLLRNTAWLAPSLEPIDEAIDMACEALAKMEQVDKDINVRSKDEPQTDCNGCRHYTDGTINKAVCDDCKRSHLDNYESQTVVGNKAELTIKDGVVKVTPIFEDEPQTKRSRW